MKYIIFMYMDSCKKYNGCIFLISARKNLLKTCLEYLDENYNNQFNYPILIFYHGDKYDDENFRESIGQINKNTTYNFHKLEAKLPDHIKEEDLFYNLKNNSYAKKKFSSKRLGYLHAVTWKINSIENEILNKYKYFMMIDDDSWFKKKININLFDELDKSNNLCGSAYTWNYINRNVLETRQHLYTFIQNYVKKYNVDIKNKLLKKYLEEGELDILDNIKYNKNFHSMNILSGNCNIYNIKMFESEEWKNYLKEFNDLSGGYRYRWTDCEIITLFYYLHVGQEFLNFGLVDKDLYCDQIDNKYNCVFDDEVKIKNEKKLLTKIRKKKLLLFKAYS